MKRGDTMNKVKRAALESINELHRTIPYDT